MAHEKVSEVLADHGLDRHRGGDVVAIKIDVSNTGHGLSESISVNPVLIPPDEVGYVIFEVEVKGDDFEKVYEGRGDDREWTGEWSLIQKLSARTALILLGDAADVIRTQVIDQAERIRIFREESTGRYTLDRALQEAHASGDHALERVVGCLGCDTEAAFEKLDSRGVEMSRPEGMSDDAWEASARAAADAQPSEIQQAVDEVAAKRRQADPAAAVEE